MKSIKVSLAQLTPKLGDKSHNLQLLEKAIAQAAEQKSNMIVFPELFLTGYAIGHQVPYLAETKNGPSLTKVKELCKTFSIYTVVGFAEIDNGFYYISSALIDDQGELRGVYRKTHLFDREKEFFTPGTDIHVFPTSLGKIGIMICFDVEFPELARTLKIKGAELIAITNANMEPYERHHHIYAKSRAMENEIPVVICNRLGEEGSLKFCGDSMVIDTQGIALLSMEKEEGVKTADLPLLTTLDPKLGYISKRRQDLYLASSKEQFV
ncbi:carbon-nitrogen hydrolase family protein [Siminovitchia sp. FSL H7-0308]|uniref:Amidohydrolase n=1 Tax=Siminovitchia thermophila TaxID=1245522 RepID=A0ABS2R790_9BACI|nr:carbon-nitrogen hydrolase family protein [Siminovitchia thermophila]MBM7715493.1 putative amidohydrolase [Siminovitchia thermophila]